MLQDGTALPTTSQPAPGVFRDAYQRLIDAGAEGIVSVHISGKLSGTLNSARQGGSLLESAPADGVRRLGARLARHCLGGAGGR